MTRRRSEWHGITSLSEQMESGSNGAGTVSRGIIGRGRPDPGGVSYGLHQFTSITRTKDFHGNVHSRPGGTVKAFVNSPECKAWKDEFRGLTPGSPEFSAAWKRVAEREPEAFADSQRNYTVRQFYEPQRKLVERATGVDFEDRSEALRAVMFSTAVQHGPNTHCISHGIEKRAHGLGKPVNELTDAQMIDAIMTERARVAQKELAPRFQREGQLALAHLQWETRGEPPQGTHPESAVEQQHPKHDAKHGPAHDHARKAPTRAPKAAVSRPRVELDVRADLKTPVNSPAVQLPEELHAKALSLDDPALQNPGASTPEARGGKAGAGSVGRKRQASSKHVPKEAPQREEMRVEAKHYHPHPAAGSQEVPAPDDAARVLAEPAAPTASPAADGVLELGLQAVAGALGADPTAAEVAISGKDPAAPAVDPAKSEPPSARAPRVPNKKPAPKGVADWIGGPHGD